MPPRSANRKSSAKAKKSTPKSNQPDIDSSNKDQESEPSEVTVNKQEDESVAPNVQEVEEAGHPVTEQKEIKQEIEFLDRNSGEIGGLNCGGEDMVVASDVVEVRAKEGVVEVERNTDIFVIEDYMNANTEEPVVENMEGVEKEGGHDSDVDVDKVEDNNLAEEKGGVEMEQHNVGGVLVNDGSQQGIVPGAEMNSAEEDNPAAQINDTEELGHKKNVIFVYEGSNRKGEGEDSGDDEDSAGDSEDNKDVDDPSAFIHNALTDRKKQKDFELFIGRLDKGVVEDDLIKVFRKFGEIKAARIVRNSTTKKSKGFAFIRYATVEQAKNALSELKDGMEVRGKHVKVSASQDNDTLYISNICKTWTKEHVLGTLKDYGIEHIEEIHLPDDSKNEGRIKGFALLEFSTHSDAMAAFQRLRKRDAVFGRDRSAKVAFTQTPLHPNEEILSQVSKVYIEGLTDAWNEEKVKEICEQYGEIVKVQLSRSLATKRKDFGFVTFASRESALACVEGINNARIGEGEVKVKASIAKPQSKGRLQKQGFRGGFKLEKKSKLSPSKRESEREAKQAGSSQMEGRAKSKRAKRKGKAVAEEKPKALTVSKIVDGGKPNKPQSVTEGQSIETASKLERPNRKRKNLPSKADGRGKGGIEHGNSKRPLKKPRGNNRGRQNISFGNPKKKQRFTKGPHAGADSDTYRNPYAPGYTASTSYYQGHAHARNAIPASNTDMEPHAGYLEPVIRKQGRPYSGYLEPPAVRTQVQPHAVYLEPATGTQRQPYAGYLEPAIRTQSQLHARYLEPTVRSRYFEPAVGRQGQPHAGYLQPAVGEHVHNPYDPRLIRAGGNVGQGSSGSAYGGGSALPPSYVPNYTSYAGFEGGARVGGYYQSGGAYLPRRA